MNLLNPAALWWLLLVPALVALYMLRPRSRRQPVPSLRLWRELPQVERPTPRLRRPPLSLLLFLQALLLGAGAFALMQPAFWSPAPHHMTVLLDASGSMQTLDGSTTRFEEARSEARNLLSKLSDTDRVTLISVGPVASTVCGSCTRTEAGRTLDALQVSAGAADWPSAISAATGLAGQKGDGSTTYAISDGAFNALTSATLPPDLHFIGVGRPADNLAITVLSARRPPNGRPDYSAYARVDNVSNSPASLQVTALADTVPLPTHDLTIPANGHSDVTWQVPAGTVKLTVALNTQDSLAADNQAVLFLPDEGQTNVLVKSDQPGLYVRALSGYAGLQPVTDTVKSQADTAFTVWEGQLPASLPAGGLLLVNPSGGGFSSSGDMNNIGSPDVVLDHPLVADLDLRALFVGHASKLNVPNWLDPIVQSPDGPLLLAGERDGRRIAVLTFDPRDSNLPKLAAFPLLMANIADWLYPQAGVGALHPGDAALVSPGSTVTAPDGRKSSVGDTGVFLDTNQVGVYTVTSPANATRSFAVNMADEREATAQPQAHPELERAAAPGPPRVVIQDFWLPVSAAVLVLAGGEWLLYCLKRGRI